MSASSQREQSQAGRLARLGFTDATRAEAFFDSPALELVRTAPDALETFSLAADPDLALLSFGRIVDAANQAGLATDMLDAFVHHEAFRTRLILVLGASESLAEHLIRHPGHWRVLADPDFDIQRPTATELRTELVGAVTTASGNGANWSAGAAALRVSYRRRLLGLAARDLSGSIGYETVTSSLADLADAVLQAGLELARLGLPEDAAPCRLAIIAMGKCGGRELNYISDVDVIFVAEPGTMANGQLADEQAALQSATAIARGVMRAASESTSEGSIWEVDAALRPEGKAGALVRTLASHIGYYERWAATWEFQALLKARFAAGDPELGRQYVDAVQPFIWSAANREDFVGNVQQMRRRVEEGLPAKDAERELKLGRGGLRDVEFSVQLLQLVHGRSDVMLRSPTTLTAIEAMAVWGYVGREDASTLSAAYRFLRTLEHRLQLYRMQRTHVVPADEPSLRRLGRSMGMRKEPAQELVDEWQRHRRAVRRLHEKLFYRPLLNAVARLGSNEARLTLEAARERLTALGYVDPNGALRHLEALTSGVSRRAAIQRTLLPVLLGWFADAPNPDAGLLAFRRVSETLGGTPWYLRLLRDESETAERMAHILASSRYATDLLLRAPEAVALLTDVNDLRPKSPEDLAREIALSASRHDQATEAIGSVKAIRRRELFRIAAADICGYLDVETVGRALSEITNATIEAALAIAVDQVQKDLAAPLPTRFTIVGMGRVGGFEAGYSSDADVMFVHDPLPGVGDQAATLAATAVANELKRLLALPSAGPPLVLDADLRPEGRAGPLVRSLASYAQYYSRWSSPWEAQALLRARPLAGNRVLSREYMALINPLRWPAEGISESDLREVRRIKARMEAERLPRGADPSLHTKLGRGGLSDVEWVAQLLQMRHAAEDPELQTTNTLEVLRAAARQGYITDADADDLIRAWCFASRVRNAVVLVTGRASDQVPTDLRVLSGVAFVLGYPPGDSVALTEDYLRLTRHARSVVERLFYGWQ